MKLLLSLVFAVSALAQSGVSVTSDGSVTTKFGTDSERIEFQTGSPSKAPYVSLINKGQGVHIAALPSGGIISIYRNIDGEAKEWLRIDADGIQVVTENGIVPTLTGAPPPGCQVDYLHGLAVAKCPEAAKLADVGKLYRNKAGQYIVRYQDGSEIELVQLKEFPKRSKPPAKAATGCPKGWTPIPEGCLEISDNGILTGFIEVAQQVAR